MASQFLKNLLNKQEALIERLITHLLPVKKGEDNYELSWEYCVGNLNTKYQSYQDVHPKDVARQFQGLEARMEQHSQVAKALRLRQLRTRLCSLGLEGAKSDMDAAILHLLFTLANRPLNTELPEVSAAWSGARLSPARTPHAQRARRVLEGGSDLDEEEEGDEKDGDDRWDSSSELSDWGQEEDEGEEEAGAAVDGSDQPHAPCIEEPAGTSAPSVPMDTAAIVLHAGAGVSSSSSHIFDATPLIPPQATPVRGDLLPSLYSARLGLLARMVAPRPDKCLTDMYVVHQVLNVLLGLGSTCFVWQPVKQPAAPSTAATTKAGTFPDKQLVPAPDVHVPYLSPSLLAALLAEFGEAGSQVAWLQQHITASTHQASSLCVAGVAAQLRLTPSVRALLQAAAAQLQVLAQPLIQLQQCNQDAATGGSNAQAVVSLLQLRQLCIAPMRKIHVLVQAVWVALSAQAAAEAAAVAGATSGAPAAHLSSTLLDSLYSQLQAAALYSGPEGQQSSLGLLHLLLCAMAPLLDSMHAWLYNSREDSFTAEFFIQPAAHLSEDDPQYWSQAYRLILRPGETAGLPGTVTGVEAKQIACPTFLRPVANEVYSAGKSLRVLKNREWSSLGPGGAAVLAAAPTRILVAHAAAGRDVGPAARGLAAGSRKDQEEVTLQRQFLSHAHGFLGHVQQQQQAQQPLSAPSTSVPGAQLPSGSMPAAARTYFDLMVGAGAGLSPAHELGAFGTPVWALRTGSTASGGTKGEATPRTPLDGDAALGGGSSPDHPQVDQQAACGVDAAGTPTKAAPAMSPFLSPGPATPGSPGSFNTSDNIQSLIDWAQGLEGTMNRQASEPASGSYLQRPVKQAVDGQSWLVPKTEAQVRLAWLLKAPHLELPAVEQLLDVCLLSTIRQRVEDVEQELLSCLLSDWGLLTELASLRNLFLLASPAAQTWASTLLRGILDGRPLHEHQEYELEMALQLVTEFVGTIAAQEAYTGSAQPAELPSIDSLSLVLDKERILTNRNKGVPDKQGDEGIVRLKGIVTVTELEGLTLRYQPTWLMSLLGGTEAVNVYNNALVFLLQIQLARMALEKARVRTWVTWKQHETAEHPARKGPNQYSRPEGSAPARPAGMSQKQEDCALQAMVHFVNNLHRFVVDRLVHGAWAQLEQDLDRARSLDDVVHHHHMFLTALDRQAGKSMAGTASGTWKHMVGAIIKMLDQVIRFCGAQQALPRQDSATIAARTLKDSSDTFQHLHRYLLHFMRNKHSKIGGDAELEVLVDLLNSNRYYDSVLSDAV